MVTEQWLKIKDSYMKQQKENPERLRAKIYAQRYTTLKTNCEKCGSRTNLERHHPDYSKPLEVLTLCKNCHEALHAKLKLEGKQPEKSMVQNSLRHCGSCGKVWPSCGSSRALTGKSPKAKGKYGCSIWEAKPSKEES